MKLVGIWMLVALAVASAGCPNEARIESITASNEGTKAYGQKQFDSAIVAYKRATDRWRENHVAWYGLGGAYAGKADWANATDAMSHAVQLEPEQGMYQLFYGRFLYEKAIQTARDDQARRENRKPEEVQPDLGSVNFEKALQHLQEAIKLNNELWRAHYYIGRIYRDTGKSKEAAEELTKALGSGPTEPGPWVALAELYRQWDYTEQAIQIAEAGTTVVPGTNEKSDVWYEVGMGYDDKRLDDKAIDAFTKSLESKRDNHKAKFQRGQAYFRKGDYTNAKHDLEDFSKAGGASVEFAKQQASKMLIDIAAKSVLPGQAPPEKLSPADAVKKGRKGK
ncbi:MAG TPA: tetratricopeptide repeat protein [Kofleriaceae bacterium]|jgi:tetratricopeptide (TPR) repeat protein|nr:tetratricopeptide repeat protein [Kofleriaceae bacterium]